MPWRVITCGEQLWHVDAIAERRANTQAWQLALSFRAASDRLRGPSRITNKALSQVLAERLP